MPNSESTLLTEGSIWKKIIAFAVPIFLGNLFQQLYNTADSLIVGNFVGSDALAAVSSSGNLIFLLVGFFSGIAMGAGVVIARYYGARSSDEISRAVHTLVALGLASGVFLTLAGVMITPQILQWMGTPDSVFPNSVLYFRIYFAGSMGFVMYNVFVGILQSVGDSKHPLYYLIISSVTNVILDLLFIAVLGMGVGAAAFATIISQFVSAFLCLARLMRTKEEYRLELKKIRFDRSMMSQMPFFTRSYFFAPRFCPIKVVMARVKQVMGRKPKPSILEYAPQPATAVMPNTIAVKIVPVIRTVFWAYPLTWSLSSIIFLIYFLKADWMHGFER